MSLASDVFLSFSFSSPQAVNIVYLFFHCSFFRQIHLGIITLLSLTSSFVVYTIFLPKSHSFIIP